MSSPDITKRLRMPLKLPDGFNGPPPGVRRAAADLIDEQRALLVEAGYRLEEQDEMIMRGKFGRREG